MSVDIYIKFSADERLLESMDLLSSWLAAVYAEMKKHPAVPAPPAKVFPLIRKGSTQEEPQEPAPKPSAEPSADAPKEKPPEEKPTVATPDAEVATPDAEVATPDAESKAETPAFVRPKPGEIRAAIRSYIGEPKDKEHDARSEVLSKWMSENSVSSIPNATDEQVQAFLAFIEEKKKEGTVHA